MDQRDKRPILYLDWISCGSLGKHEAFRLEGQLTSLMMSYQENVASVVDGELHLCQQGKKNWQEEKKIGTAALQENILQQYHLLVYCLFLSFPVNSHTPSKVCSIPVKLHQLFAHNEASCNDISTL